MRRRILFSLLLLLSLPILAQGQTDGSGAFFFVGMKLEEVFERFGAPIAVYAARGIEVWQDDVIFQYSVGDFYIFGDRVWQVRLPAAYGISAGDPKAAVLLVLGNAAEDMDDHVLIPLTGQDWPLVMRINFNKTYAVSAIYVYRPDF
ncbi:MAG: hypothetical protein FWC03_03505 [Treponema sp.]|nr:hypothetical protein [Treponema sp.]